MISPNQSRSLDNYMFRFLDTYRKLSFLHNFLSLFKKIEEKFYKNCKNNKKEGTRFLQRMTQFDFPKPMSHSHYNHHTQSIDLTSTPRSINDVLRYKGYTSLYLVCKVSI